jgi:hypothetical protein
MELNFADLLKPSLPGLVLLWLEVILVMFVGKYLMNRYFPNTSFTKLVNAA